MPSVVSTGYLYNTSTSGNVASASTVHLNASSWSTATILYASVVNSNGKRIDAQAEEYLKPGAIILLQNMKGSGDSHLKARVTSASFTSTTITIGLAAVSVSGSTPSSLDNVSLGVITTTNAYSIEQALGFDVEDATGVGAFTTTELTDNATLKSTLETLGSKAKILREGLGVSVGDTDLGTFTGATISDNTTVKTALQELETATEQGFSGDYDDLTGKPSFATVATSGAYSDLTGTPEAGSVSWTPTLPQATGGGTLTQSAKATWDANTITVQASFYSTGAQINTGLSGTVNGVSGIDIGRRLVLPSTVPGTIFSYAIGNVWKTVVGSGFSNEPSPSNSTTNQQNCIMKQSDLISTDKEIWLPSYYFDGLNEEDEATPSSIVLTVTCVRAT